MATIVGADDVAREVGAVLRRSGVSGRYVRSGGCVGYEYSVPTNRGTVLRVRSWARDEGDEVAGRASRKAMRKRRRARIKKKLKKVVKNKAFKALGQVAKMAASVIPGGGAVMQAAELGVRAGKAIKQAKNLARKGDARMLSKLPGALKAEARALRRA